MFERLKERANADPNVARVGRTCSTEFVLSADGTPWHVIVENGVVKDVLKGPFKMRGASFRIEATSEAWQAYMTAAPPPGLHDIFAMSATGNARIEGDMAVLHEHLWFFKTLLVTLREDAR